MRFSFKKDLKSLLIHRTIGPSYEKNRDIESIQNFILKILKEFLKIAYLDRRIS